MKKKQVFVSFDFENDGIHRNLLTAFNNNRNFDVMYHEHSINEMQNCDVERIKAVVARKIQEATHVLVIVGEHANKCHPEQDAIGETNWQCWEIYKAINEGKKIIAIKIKSTNPAPIPLQNINTRWIMSFDMKTITDTINSF
ncbi:TIR domain-containing protein [uncultured Desulfobulbus sp.]|uniref:TIR domain-containing protein n=1 Tax=uncultured Desulfobulbus sp. TaxID=239745 RepID=UPI0029C78205|nr:TIR domain-containing protein [uncultured Desulfobulbus sp.]